MKNLTIPAQDSNEQTMTMTSLDYLDKINGYRLEDGQKELPNSKFLLKLEDEIDDLSVSNLYQPTKGGTPMRYYNLTEEQMMLVGMRESKVVRKKVFELIKSMAKAIQNQKPPQLPKTYLEAMRAHVLQLEMNEEQKVIIDGLEQSLDVSEQWLSILRVSKDRGVSERSFKWQVLKRKSIEMGIEIKKVQCPRFGFKNLYHVAVFKECYPQLPRI